MNDIPLYVLVIALVVLLLGSAFFSASETAMMSLNRYRMRHLAQNNHGGAQRAQMLLDQPDRFIGLVLLGNNFVNTLASAAATLIALRLYGDSGIAVATGVMTFLLLIFGEVTPKTLAALYPERFAFPAAYIYEPAVRFFYPVIWSIGLLTKGILRLFGVTNHSPATQQLSREELRTVVNEAGALIPQRHQQMLISILDLENATVEDVMVPRADIVGVDLESEWSDIITLITSSQHTRLPLYRGNIDQVVGTLHMRNIVHRLGLKTFDRDSLTELASPPYFIPEGTPLHKQLLNFQDAKQRTGLVVDEYGDITGLVTIDDILEEIVGEFTTDASAASLDVVPQNDGSYLVAGNTNIRDLNRSLRLHLPTNGPKTINGLILEVLETIPEPGTGVLINNYPIEIVQTADNTVRVVRVGKRLRKRKWKTNTFPAEQDNSAR